MSNISSFLGGLLLLTGPSLFEMIRSSCTQSYMSSYTCMAFLVNVRIHAHMSIVALEEMK